MKIVIGSRGSKLALWQANWVKDRLAEGGHRVEIQIIKTTGDRIQKISPDKPLPTSIAQVVAEAGTKGLFIKEIEEALIAGDVDVAVHSLKDLPTVQPAGLEVAVVPKREDARDVLISANGKRLEELRPGARIGTSSLRRQTQLKSLRRDLEILPLRGNLDTRLRKLERGDYDAVVLAAAGVHRLGLRERITAYFSIDQMCPAVGQGALGIEIRSEDAGVREAVQLLDDHTSHLRVRAERTALRRLGGGCQVPIAAHALIEDDQLRLWGVVASEDGSRVIRATTTGSADKPEELGMRVAEELLKHGAQAILDAVTASQ